MKIRKGFVTNSSSTSYTIVLKDEKPEGYFSLLDILKVACTRSKVEMIDEKGTILFDTKNSKPSVDERAFKIENLDGFIRSAETNIEWMDEYLPQLEAELEKLQAFTTQDDTVVKMLFADTFGDNKGTLDSALKNLQYKIQRKTSDIKDYKKQLEFDKKQLETLKEFKEKDNEDTFVLFLDVDNWGGSSIEYFIEKSKATVLKKERT